MYKATKTMLTKFDVYFINLNIQIINSDIRIIIRMPFGCPNYNSDVQIIIRMSELIIWISELRIWMSELIIRMSELIIWISELRIWMSELIIRMYELIKWTSNLVNIIFVALYTVYFTFLSFYTVNILMSQMAPHTLYIAS